MDLPALQSLLPVAFTTARYTAAEIADTPYTAIQLRFRTEAPYAPDGDSIRMQALHPSLWPPRVKLSPKGDTVQSRMEGIDALELHFAGHHQPLLLAERARDALFEELHVPKKNPPPEGVAGWALTRSADLYGRSVTFLFPEEAPLVDGNRYMTGERSFLDLLKQSANYRLLSMGMAYPMFYEYLPRPLLESMQETVVEARKKRRGIWFHDQTLEGVRIMGMEDVDAAVVYPKLYRRLVRYFNEFSPIRGLGRFREFMELDPDQLHLASEARVRPLHDPDILEINRAKNSLRLLVPPEQLIFQERRTPNPRLPAR